MLRVAAALLAAAAAALLLDWYAPAGAPRPAPGGWRRPRAPQPAPGAEVANLLWAVQVSGQRAWATARRGGGRRAEGALWWRRVLPDPPSCEGLGWAWHGSV